MTLSVITLAKGLLAPGDRRWDECTRHLRQMTGLEMVQHKAPDIGTASFNRVTIDVMTTSPLSFRLHISDDIKLEGKTSTYTIGVIADNPTVGRYQIIYSF